MATSTLSLASQLAHASAEERAALMRELSDEEVAALEYDWGFWGRPEQQLPEGDWHAWLILAGRGWGKTRTGAEAVNHWAQQGPIRIALIAETAADARDVMVEGESGILNCAPPWCMPHYQPSKRRVTWPTGAIAITYSGDKPSQLRGPQHHKAWADEPAKWRYGVDAWDMMEFGLRLGETPQVVATTTPRPIPLITTLVKDEATLVTRGSTYDNAPNLSPRFMQRIRERYEGTRLGRQELHAELLEDTPGALWTRALLEKNRVRQVPALRRIVVGLDPGAEAGIVVAGLGEDGLGYVLEDLSLEGSPIEWAKQSVAAYHKYKANAIIAERNHGGEMVETTIRTVDATVNVETVWASHGKYARAEPVSALYEQLRVRHVGMFAYLEDEYCNWVPGENLPSPNRLDAGVWALTALMLDGGPAEASDIESAPEDHYHAQRRGRYGLAR